MDEGEMAVGQKEAVTGRVGGRDGRGGRERRLMVGENRSRESGREG